MEEKSDLAQNRLLRIIRIYENASQSRQARLRFYAGHAYAWQGAIGIRSSQSLSCETVGFSATHYQQVISLLETDT